MDEIYPSGHHFQIYLTKPNKLESMPQMYLANVKNKLFTPKSFWLMVLISIVQSYLLVIISFYSLGTFYSGVYGVGYQYDIFLIGGAGLTATLVAANLMIG